jgi:threonine/homoserine/homoserine lactone efflux protein
MAESLAEALALALAIAVSPPPIVAMVLVLTSRRGRANGALFLLGWLLGLAAVGATVLLLLGPTSSDDGTKPGWRRVVELVAGIALLVLAVRHLRSRPAAGEAGKQPAWMARIDGLGPGGAVGLGLALTVANPKNLLLAAGGAAVLAEAGLSGTGQLLGYVAFVAVASLGVVVPLAISVLAGERSDALLETLKGWLGRNNSVIMAVVCAALGAVLVIAAVTG